MMELVVMLDQIQYLQVGINMELSIKEKINLLKQWLNNLDVHIESLTQAINDYPDSDIEGKIPRSQILNDLINKKTFYLQELDKLNTEML